MTVEVLSIIGWEAEMTDHRNSKQLVPHMLQILLVACMPQQSRLEEQVHLTAAKNRDIVCEPTTTVFQAFLRALRRQFYLDTL